MVTALPRPLLAAWHTFVVNEHARAATPGMPVLYERLSDAHDAPPVFYLSTGAWNVAPTLTRFLSSNLYPPGALLLTDWGPTKDRWFRSGKEHKRGNLRRWATEFPQIKWLLFGDDGQHDEMLYREFADAHPDQVVAVCIRQLTPGEAVLAGSSLRESPSPEGSQVPWLYAHDGAGLAHQLEELGVLPPERSPRTPCEHGLGDDPSRVAGYPNDTAVTSRDLGPVARRRSAGLRCREAHNRRLPRGSTSPRRRSAAAMITRRRRSKGPDHHGRSRLPGDRDRRHLPRRRRRRDPQRHRASGPDAARTRLVRGDDHSRSPRRRGGRALPGRAQGGLPTRRQRSP